MHAQRIEFAKKRQTNGLRRGQSRIGDQCARLRSRNEAPVGQIGSIRESFTFVSVICSQINENTTRWSHEPDRCLEYQTNRREQRICNFRRFRNIVIQCTMRFYRDDGYVELIGQYDERCHLFVKGPLELVHGHAHACPAKPCAIWIRRMSCHGRACAPREHECPLHARAIPRVSTTRNVDPRGDRI